MRTASWQFSLEAVGFSTQGLRSAHMQSFVAQRVEKRLAMKTTALLIGRHGRLGVERAITENVSSRGVRVISASEWYTDDTILVSLPAGHFTSAARVTYCDPMGQGQFVTGLEFVGKEPLQLTAMTPES
jgi:hypothetical protein